MQDNYITNLEGVCFLKERTHFLFMKKMYELYHNIDNLETIDDYIEYWETLDWDDPTYTDEEREHIKEALKECYEEQKKEYEEQKKQEYEEWKKASNN